MLRALYKARNIIVTNIKLSKFCLVINWHTKILSSLVGESDADAFAFSFCVRVQLIFIFYQVQYKMMRFSIRVSVKLAFRVCPDVKKYVCFPFIFFCAL